MRIATRRGSISILLVSMAAAGIVFAASPHARACDVDDDVDAAAEELLQTDEPAPSGRATTSMSCKLLVPGPHLRLTSPRRPTPADIARAGEIRARMRQALAKYQDYRVALQDDFEIRFPNIPQKLYHFSNRANALHSAREGFDPLRPTSLIYERDFGGYKLLGVMYTAPRRFSEADLDSRFPISVAPWHLHTNFCLAPPALYQKRKAGFTPDRRFGANGSISTEQACTAAGGLFRPFMYGWMTHVDLYDSADKD